VSDITLNEVHRFPLSTENGVMCTLTRYGWFVSVGNVQSRPKGDSSLGILFENPLKLRTHSLAYAMYV
jgi:hypothetical protein